MAQDLESSGAAQWPPYDEPIEIQPSMLDRPRRDFERDMNTFPIVTLLLALACIGIFLAQFTLGALGNVDDLVRIGALNGVRVAEGEIWRLLSAVFMHGSFSHLYGNIVALFILGMAAEHAFGRAQFITLFVTAGVAGSLSSLVAGRTSVGASGAIFGIMASLIVFFVKFRSDIHLRDARIGFVIAVWAAYQLSLGFLTPGVDNLAHLGGLAGGALLGLLLFPAVLIGTDETLAHPLTRTGLTLAITCLAATAVLFLPRLVR